MKVVLTEWHYTVSRHWCSFASSKLVTLPMPRAVCWIPVLPWH